MKVDANSRVGLKAIANNGMEMTEVKLSNQGLNSLIQDTINIVLNCPDKIEVLNLIMDNEERKDYANKGIIVR